jgi:hypothetical protein
MAINLRTLCCGPRLALVVIVIAVLPQQAQAALDLDTTFGTDGKVLTDFSGNGDGGNGVAQDDGKMEPALASLKHTTCRDSRFACLGK